jgi:hypothetical protein
MVGASGLVPVAAPARVAREVGVAAVAGPVPGS